MNQVEILAPAGNKDAFLAALGAGADAIYVGLGSFNARRGAQNFTLKSLKQCTKRAHLMGAKVYVTVNILVLPHEMEEALELVADVWNAGVDAVIVQDLGLLREIVARLPEVRIHASTQINVHDGQSVRALADLGVKRITLARELSIDEIATLVAIGRESDVEIEVFAHGALCVSHSGQCLFSSLVGRRSANRGMCAQPCRLEYELIDRKGEVLSAELTHLLSPRDLCAIEHLEKLVEIGVASLKIEGRMKSPGYVATVVSNYRQAFDEITGAVDRRVEASRTYVSHQPESDEIQSAKPWRPLNFAPTLPAPDTSCNPDENSQTVATNPPDDGGEESRPALAVPELAASYNRGFTEAYLIGERGNEMMSYRVGAGKERSHEIAEFAQQAIDRALALDISEIVVSKRVEFTPSPLRKRKVKFGQQHIDVVCVVATVGAARAALNADANEAHISAHELLEVEAMPGVAPVLPRVCHDHELEELIGVAYRFGGAVCSTLGQLRLCQERGIPAQAHWALNATNPQACEVLAELGATRIWLSAELSQNQISAITRRTSVPLGIAVAGLTEIMITEHCVLMAQGECRQKCLTCNRRTNHTALRDRKGYCFPVRTDPSGRSHIYNSVPLDLTEALPEILSSGVSAVRLDLETARTEFVPQEVARIRHALIDVYAGREVPVGRESTTRGHFYRGVV